ncbi:hypothetical protein O3G_MSEX001618 [Manduca sexta]|uniref:Cilia- and flagella-associated protein 61 N-terminal domain-containing protein n=1 Tax=Manduca sexta TaxID=7130 RepID=A0A921YLP0_MANSE|nr:hypothetical protein O3G_MSEX001618 [Manduca sexta]
MASRIFRPPPLGRLRLASVDDAPFIFDLVNESMSKHFRIENTYNVIYLIENAVLSICQLDGSDTIVGFIAARDYPLIPSVHPQAWEKYIWTKYKAIELNSRNTLFIHLMCWNCIYARDIVDNMLKSIFMHDAYVQHIAMMKTVVDYPLLVPGQSRSEGSFRRVQAMERGIPGDILPSLSIADRSEVSPRLRIRRAVEEDNDDIVPIIERHSARLRQLYGEFYVSELISRHPESERVLLVCEHKEVAVGVMCLNTQINYEALEESFELSPFAGLRHMDVSHFHKLSKNSDSTARYEIFKCILNG